MGTWTLTRVYVNAPSDGTYDPEDVCDVSSFLNKLNYNLSVRLLSSSRLSPHHSAACPVTVLLYIFIRLDRQQTAHNTQLENTIKHNHTQLKER